MEELVVEKDIEVRCYHCGNVCQEVFSLSEKSFCCQGCKTVYEILSANDLCEYYAFNKNAGLKVLSEGQETYAYLDEKEIRRKVVSFDANDFVRVEFYVPAIHCISCIWLLENLQRVKKGILKSEVNFSKKIITVDFTSSQVKLSEVAQVLSSVGYSPKINLENDAAGLTKHRESYLVAKLAVAGFCFGNVMLFSFPEYLGLGHADGNLQKIFSYLNIALSIPVFFYSGVDYFKACLRSLTEKQINIDVPIAVGLLALFLRSTWDIVTGFGPGYLDSFTGLVFFLLIGRWFQSKTYESLAFDRDFKSYFPLAVHKFIGDGLKPVVIYELEKGDRIQIRNMEIVPADSIVVSESALIDYSFVTGESKPVQVLQGELVYAGGRLIGQPVVLAVDKKTSQSHLTSLWNHEAFQKQHESRYKKIIDKAARRFTWIVMFIALATSIYWYVVKPEQMWLVLTAVLMVACPCALALAAPFTYGSMLRVFGRHNFYLKNADIIERLGTIDSIVFDKTGTVTHGEKPNVEFIGILSDTHQSYVKQLTSFSTHPLSSLICKSIQSNVNVDVEQFKEIPGKGIEGNINGDCVRLGSAIYVGAVVPLLDTSSKVYVSINDEVIGYYRITTAIRQGIVGMLKRLGKRVSGLVSGDNETDKKRMQEVFEPHVTLLFNQGPHDKLDYIRSLQHVNKRVLMVGDGLNDAGALKQSDVGIAVTDDTGVFTPACDGILQGSKIGSLDKFLELAKSSSVILKTGFAISFFYNAIALSFAVSGYLTPLVAAILMPISSISVVSFTSLGVNYVAKRKKL